jgi:purine nucleoside permease
MLRASRSGNHFSPLVVGAVVTLLFVAKTVRSDPSTARAVKVLVITTSDAEAKPYGDALGLTDSVPVPGLSEANPAVRCNADGVCLLTTGPGKANAAASVMAVIESEPFDLSHTYFLVAGLAAIDPGEGTVGSVTWAQNVVDSGIAWEIDARALPAGWSTGYLGILAKSPSDKPGSSFGTEFYPLVPSLVAKALALSESAALEDGPAASAYRAHYAASPATEPPKVITCDTTTSDTYWHGELLGQRAHDWVAAVTGGKGAYCTMQQTDNATIAALHRGADAGLLDAKRVLVLHAASRFDRQYPGQSAAESFAADAGGNAVALHNLAIAGVPVIAEIVANWDAWQTGVPE